MFMVYRYFMRLLNQPGQDIYKMTGLNQLLRHWFCVAYLGHGRLTFLMAHLFSNSHFIRLTFYNTVDFSRPIIFQTRMLRLTSFQPDTLAALAHGSLGYSMHCGAHTQTTHLRSIVDFVKHTLFPTRCCIMHKGKKACTCASSFRAGEVPYCC